MRRMSLCNPAIQMAGGSGSTIAQGQVESAVGRAIALGHRDSRETYAVIAEFVRRMARLPGERTLILVSPGFLNIEPDSLTAGSQIVELAAQSKVVVSAIDARGLFSDQTTASELSRGEGGLNPEYRRTEKRLAADPMAELANGTGGTFFHNNNDLDAGFRLLTGAPGYVYVPELPVDDVKPDGSWHRLKVRVACQGLEVQARHGYRMPRAENKKAAAPAQLPIAQRHAEPSDVPASAVPTSNARASEVPTSDVPTLRVTSSLSRCHGVGREWPPGCERTYQA